MAAPRNLLDHIRPGVRILFVGINPGIRSAETGHHFAGFSNRFWKLLWQSKLVSEPLTYREDERLPEWRLGLTNMVRRPSAGIEMLTARDYAVGRVHLAATVKRYHPSVLALLGVTIYRRLFPGIGAEPVSLGLQSDRFAGSRIFVLPNPSGRNANYSYEEMLDAFRRLKRFA